MGSGRLVLKIGGRLISELKWKVGLVGGGLSTLVGGWPPKQIPVTPLKWC